jgi:hypothetical protein
METVWMKFECGGGARWTSTCEDYAGKVCCFSGCNCGTVVKLTGKTTDRSEASAWFRRPLVEPTPESEAFEAMLAD